MGALAQATAMDHRYYTVDRITGGKAVLVDDQGQATTVPLGRFRRGIAETMILRVPLDGTGEPDWLGSEVDPDETARRARKSAQYLQVLKEQDWGGGTDE